MNIETDNSRAVIGGNQPPTDFDAVKREIEDLFGEAINFADGEPIADQGMHDAIEKLYDALHEAGKRADEMRKAEKRPLDEAIDAIQSRYNPLVQPKKGKVALGKDALGVLLAAWRAEQQRLKAAEAARKDAEAEAARQAAEAAIRASSGNLEARIDAEELLAHAKSVATEARRADRQATTGTGLRTVWHAEIADKDAALEWAYGKDAGRFTALALDMANEAVRLGARDIPGFVVKDEKRAV